MELPYTICFCCYEQQVLMLHRTLPPNAQLWNGLGGKIEAGETPLVSVQREMQEEADIDLSEASSLFFAGITTWGPMSLGPQKGMYAFIAQLSEPQAKRVHELATPEGLISWKPLSWACNPSNPTVVNNIPRFLPPMLTAKSPYEYFHTYEGELVIRPLPTHIVLSECQGW